MKYCLISFFFWGCLLLVGCDSFSGSRHDDDGTHIAHSDMIMGTDQQSYVSIQEIPFNAPDILTIPGPYDDEVMAKQYIQFGGDNGQFSIPYGRQVTYAAGKGIDVSGTVDFSYGSSVDLLIDPDVEARGSIRYQVYLKLEYHRLFGSKDRREYKWQVTWRVLNSKQEVVKKLLYEGTSEYSYNYRSTPRTIFRKTKTSDRLMGPDAFTLMYRAPDPDETYTMHFYIRSWSRILPLTKWEPAIPGWGVNQKFKPSDRSKQTTIEHYRLIVPPNRDAFDTQHHWTLEDLSRELDSWGPNAFRLDESRLSRDQLALLGRGDDQTYNIATVSSFGKKPTLSEFKNWEKGDLIFKRSRIKNVVNKVSHFSHVGIVYNPRTGETFESNPRVGNQSGVDIYRFDHRWQHASEFVRKKVKASQSQISKTVDAAVKRYRGTTYYHEAPRSTDLNVVLSTFFNKGSTSSIYCSELVWLTYKGLGIDLDSERIIPESNSAKQYAKSVVLPDEILLSNHLKPTHYNWYFEE